MTCSYPERIHKSMVNEETAVSKISLSSSHDLIEFVTHRANLHMPDSRGRTPLHSGVRGAVGIVRQLIDAGADPAAKD